jgi:hypothetical protein
MMTSSSTDTSWSSARQLARCLMGKTRNVGERERWCQFVVPLWCQLIAPFMVPSHS